MGPDPTWIWTAWSYISQQTQNCTWIKGIEFTWSYSIKNKQNTIQYFVNYNASLYEPSPKIQLLESGDANDYDVELPIAHRKGIKSCTQHPINRYVFYSHLNRKYRCFILSFFSSMICRVCWKKDPTWRKLYLKNEMWEVVPIPKNAHLIGFKWDFYRMLQGLLSCKRIQRMWLTI